MFFVMLFFINLVLAVLLSRIIVFCFFSAYILDLFSFFPLGHFSRIITRLSWSYTDPVGHPVVSVLVVNYNRVPHHKQSALWFYLHTM